MDVQSAMFVLDRAVDLVKSRPAMGIDETLKDLRAISGALLALLQDYAGPIPDPPCTVDSGEDTKVS